MLTRKVKELELHPTNSRIYGATRYDHLTDSIKKQGVYEPILITKDNLIINGGRRWVVAKMLGLEEVPVIVYHSEDDLDIKEAVVHCNKVREKTPYVVCTEATVLFEVEKERARRRQLENLKRGNAPQTQAPVQEPVPEREQPGQARDKVGEFLEVSGPTAERMAAIGKVMKKAEEEGDQDTVQKLNDDVKKRGVKAVWRDLKGKEEAEALPEPTPTTKEDPTPEPEPEPEPTTAANQEPVTPSDLAPATKLFKRLKAILYEVATRPEGEQAVRQWCVLRGIDHRKVLSTKNHAGK